MGSFRGGSLVAGQQRREERLVGKMGKQRLKLGTGQGYTDTSPVPFRSDSLRDGMEHREPVLGTERYHHLILVYRYRFIPVRFDSD
ncbi:hypothetical protein KY284_008154 [Solanum tuberosum]|nr:hypothetical protein KY284_008154 [Solanum tuberosum]